MRKMGGGGGETQIELRKREENTRGRYLQNGRGNERGRRRGGEMG